MKIHMARIVCGVLALTLFVVPAGTVALPQQGQTAEELQLALTAKVVCSAVFVSGRDMDEALEHSTLGILPGADALPRMKFRVDRKEQAVYGSLEGQPTRKATYYGDQGCIIHPADNDGIFFEPVRLQSALPAPATQPWPMGDQLPKASLPSDVDSGKLQEAVESAFANPASLTTAFLVVHKGRIIAERYAIGVGPDTQNESWSMGKSLTTTLVGLLIQQGYFDLDDPAPVETWQEEGDPRAAIRVADLLRMSSGLQFTSLDSPQDTWTRSFPDHFFIYAGAVNVFDYSLRQPLEHTPNTVGRYRNCDPLTLGYLVRKFVEAQGEEYLSFPQRALFDKIGIRKQVLETDAWGNFILTGFDYGTARNWARLGLLYLNDGVWQGERLLPEGFTKFVSTPAPGWTVPRYGGLFWLNRTGTWNLPDDAYYMAGFGLQVVIIVPSRDLVVVRMGHTRGGRPGTRDLNNALALLIEALPDGN